MPHNSFRQTWTALGLAGSPEPTLGELLRAYAEPQRAYHTLTHIEEGLALIDRLAESWSSIAHVRWAWWFHDAMYQPLRPDNEVRSAAWAARVLRTEGGAEEDVAQVQGLIQTTAGHLPGSGDTSLFAQVDLAILGATNPRFRAYCDQVRTEYAAVPEAAFRAGRRAVLTDFLARMPLFQHPALAHLNARAEYNLCEALKDL